MAQPTQTILVVDDQSHIRFLLEQVLEPLRHSGVLVVTAANGLDALALAQTLQPKLIFLDVLLPKLNGFEVCRQIRQQAHLDRPYITFVTMKGQEADQAEGKAAGGDLYLTKPFNPDQIFNIAIQVLQLPIQPRSNSPL
ncbi:MAG: response regulator [Prochlorothrix sp.]